MQKGTAKSRGFYKGRRYWPGASIEIRDTDQVPDWVELDDGEAEEAPVKKKKAKKAKKATEESSS
tara:strand:- start:517 stop:711 length:195 start_codon:yes stop_codon:yes gene_type:complete